MRNSNPIQSYYTRQHKWRTSTVLPCPVQAPVQARWTTLHSQQLPSSRHRPFPLRPCLPLALALPSSSFSQPLAPHRSPEAGSQMLKKAVSFATEFAKREEQPESALTASIGVFYELDPLHSRNALTPLTGAEGARGCRPATSTAQGPPPCQWESARGCLLGASCYQGIPPGALECR